VAPGGNSDKMFKWNLRASRAGALCILYNCFLRASRLIQAISGLVWQLLNRWLADWAELREIQDAMLHAMLPRLMPMCFKSS
jgi:hypothetical protein